VDSTEIENETIGTGLATTEKWEFTIGAKRKKKGHEIAARRVKDWDSRKEYQIEPEERKSAKPKIICCWWSWIGVRANNEEPT
jgi:hypothetical protein